MWWGGGCGGGAVAGVREENLLLRFLSKEAVAKIFIQVGAKKRGRGIKSKDN